jgi:hypothetical protein
VSELEIEIETLLSNKATAVPMKCLHHCSLSLFHKSLRLGTVPEEWKLANVVPVFKKGEKCHCENYRPMSLLLIVSKQLERCVFMNIKCHLSQSRTQSMPVRRLGACPAPNLRTGILWVRDCICPKSLASVSTGSFKVNPV